MSTVTKSAYLHIGLILLNSPLKKLLRLDAAEQTSVICSNAGNLIIPLVTALLGKDWVIYSCACLSVQMVLLRSHGKAVLCGEKGINLRKIVTNINMIAILDCASSQCRPWSPCTSFEHSKPDILKGA